MWLGREIVVAGLVRRLIQLLNKITRLQSLSELSQPLLLVVFKIIILLIVKKSGFKTYECWTDSMDQFFNNQAVGFGKVLSYSWKYFDQAVVVIYSSLF